MKEEFLDDINDLYEDVREDHYASLADRKFLSLEKARAKALTIDWTTFDPVAPQFLGTKVFLDYDSVKKESEILKAHVNKNFSKENIKKIYDKMIFGELNND